MGGVGGAHHHSRGVRVARCCWQKGNECDLCPGNTRSHSVGMLLVLACVLAVLAAASGATATAVPLSCAAVPASLVDRVPRCDAAGTRCTWEATGDADGPQVAAEPARFVAVLGPTTLLCDSGDRTVPPHHELCSFAAPPALTGGALARDAPHGPPNGVSTRSPTSFLCRAVGPHATSPYGSVRAACLLVQPPASGGHHTHSSPLSADMSQLCVVSWLPAGWRLNSSRGNGLSGVSAVVVVDPVTLAGPVQHRWCCHRCTCPRCMLRETSRDRPNGRARCCAAALDGSVVVSAWHAKPSEHTRPHPAVGAG